MSKKFNIAVDAMGGDHAPEKVLAGVDLFLKKNKKHNVNFNLYGNGADINKIINKYKNINKDNSKIIHAPDKVPGNVSVRDAIKLGKKTSMWMSIESVKNGESDIVVSSGNTGALLVISKLILKMIEGLDKPALAGIWPNHKDYSIVLDLGANVECSDKNLVEFSIMGSELYKAIYNKDDVVAGLLNIGSEEIKGNEQIKNAHIELEENKNLNFNYRGYVEGNEIKNGEVHVIVTDGFTGNVALKTAEGTANFITTEIKQSFSKSFFSKLDIFLVILHLKKLKKS